MFKFKSNVVGSLKVLGKIVEYGDIIEVSETDLLNKEFKKLIITKQIIKCYE